MVLSQYWAKMSKPDVFDGSIDTDATEMYSAAGVLPLIAGLGRLSLPTDALGVLQLGLGGLGSGVGGLLGLQALGLGNLFGSVPDVDSLLPVGMMSEALSVTPVQVGGFLQSVTGFLPL